MEDVGREERVGTGWGNVSATRRGCTDEVVSTDHVCVHGYIRNCTQPQGHVQQQLHMQHSSV